MLARRTLITLLFVLPAAAAPFAHAGSEDTLGRGPVALAWSYRATQPPSPAFKGGLATWRDVNRVEPIRYDYVFQPVVTGGRLFFGSSTEEAVFCLDAQTGALQWTFYAQGPVRLAPTVWQDRIFFGSDDGFVYCLRQATGEIVWKYRAAAGGRRAVGNQRVISAWPVRTTIAIAEGVAYFGAGLFPPLGTYLHAVDARTGEPIWSRQVPNSLHGSILVDGDRLLVATGRTCPAEFRRSNGSPLVEKPDARRAQGSSFIGRAGDMVYWGPCESGLLHIRVSPEPLSGEARHPGQNAVAAGRITGLKGWRLLADERVYLLRDEQIVAIDRQQFRSLAAEYCYASARYARDTVSKDRPWGIAAAGMLLKEHPALAEQLKRNAVWTARNEHGLKSLALVDGALVAGGKDVVLSIDGATGNLLWKQPVEGNALGLASGEGALFVSTDRGRIYCLRAGEPAAESPGQTAQLRQHQPKPLKVYRDDPGITHAAAMALTQTGRRKGYCLVLGAGDGQLAFEIAKRSEFFVVAVDPDAERVAVARRKLTEAGRYGVRIVVHHVAPDDLAYPAYFANLIVSEACLRTGRQPYPANAVLGLLQPYGGVIVLGGPQGVDFAHRSKAEEASNEWHAEALSDWETMVGEGGMTWYVAHRGPLPGAGRWTHLYADPANTVCSGDRRLGPDLALQWFGPPGAEDVVERHAVAMPPLFANGRLFVSGRYDTIQAVDAYNGTRLWEVKVPESTRMMLSHNAGFMAAAEEALFVAAKSTCWMLDAATGKLVHKFAGVNPESDWGYVATTGNYLLGTSQKPAADQYSSGRRREGYRIFVQAKSLQSRPAVSDNLFVYELRTRQLSWSYDNGSVILNPTITVGGERVYFAESRNRAVVEDPTGTASLPEFFAKDVRLVALDLHCGRPLWSKPLGPLSADPQDTHEHIMFLSYADGKLLSTRTGHVKQKLSYRLQALDASDGSLLWEQLIPSRHRIYAPLIYGKNGQQAHPSIAGGRVYLLSHITDALITMDLATGTMARDPALYQFWIHSKTCAVPTASADGLFFRRNSCYMFDLASGRAIDLTGVTRPGCWMSIIPAGGLLLMPEASSGCTCGFALQTSVVMLPRAAPRPVDTLSQDTGFEK